MQLGRLEDMDQAKINHVEKLSKVKVVEEQDKILPDEVYKHEDESQHKIYTNEVILDNVKFGFNSKTKEFFLRVQKEGIEYQFPTEQIMRLKEYLKDDLKQYLNKSQEV